MSCILFIGYGNPLRGDDGFGWLLAQRLEQKFHGCDIECLAAHQLTPELAEPISRARYVIFADATTEDTGGLCLKRLRVHAATENSFSHEMQPEALLTLAQTLYGSSPHAAFLCTAQAHTLDHQQELSPEMTVELDKAVDRIAALCEFLSPGSSGPRKASKALVPLAV